MGLAAVAAHKLGGLVPVGAIFKASLKIGQVVSRLTTHEEAGRELPPVLPSTLTTEFEEQEIVERER